MSSMTFTTYPHPVWDKKIAEGLYEECEVLTGHRKSLEPLTIYAESDGVFRGGITIEQDGKILWIDSLWVDPDFRKQAVGQKLLEQAFLWATKGNATEYNSTPSFQLPMTFSFLKGLKTFLLFRIGNMA